MLGLLFVASIAQGPIRFHFQGGDPVSFCKALAKVTRKPIVLIPCMDAAGNPVRIDDLSVEGVDAGAFRMALRLKMGENRAAGFANYGLNMGMVQLSELDLNDLPGAAAYLTKDSDWIQLQRTYYLNPRRWANVNGEMTSPVGAAYSAVVRLSELPWSHPLVINSTYGNVVLCIQVDSASETDVLDAITSALGAEESIDSSGTVHIDPSPAIFKELLTKSANFYKSVAAKRPERFAFAEEAFATASNAEIQSCYDKGIYTTVDLSGNLAAATLVQRMFLQVAKFYQSKQWKSTGKSIFDFINLDAPVAGLGPGNLPAAGFKGKAGAFDAIFF